MHDDLTLPDTSDESLLRAAFATDESSLAFLETTLGADQPRQRVLALRGLARRDAITPILWLSALQDSDVDVRREALTLIAQSSPDDDLLPLVRAALADRHAADPERPVRQKAPLHRGRHPPCSLISKSQVSMASA